MMETFPIPVFMLALLGLAVTLWKWRELLFIYTMIALTIAQALFFYGSARFRAPIEPMLILLASGSSVVVYQLPRKGRCAGSSTVREKQALHPSIINAITPFASDAACGGDCSKKKPGHSRFADSEPRVDRLLLFTFCGVEN